MKLKKYYVVLKCTAPITTKFQPTRTLPCFNLSAITCLVDQLSCKMNKHENPIQVLFLMLCPVFGSYYCGKSLHFNRPVC